MGQLCPGWPRPARAPVHTACGRADLRPAEVLSGSADDVNLQPPAPATPCETAVNGTPYASLFGNTPFRIDDHLQPSDTTCPQPFQEFSRPNGWAKGQGTPGGCTRDIVHRFYQEQYQ